MQLPLFTKAEDPLDADVWLRVVESKFPLLTGYCPMTPRLASPRSSFADPLEHGGTIFAPCYLLIIKFHGRSSRLPSRLPTGILDRKLNEFLALNQGTRTVL
jgi:hypothetical protein